MRRYAENKTQGIGIIEVRGVKLNFIGIDLDQKWVLDRLSKRIGFHDEREYNIYFKKEPHIKVSKDGLNLYVECATESEMGRCLLLAVQLIKNGVDTTVLENAQFRTMGIMLDMSRAGVMKVSKVKEYMEYLCLLGLNTLYLYMEDVYEVEGYPYFGYLRGRYTKEELKEIDAYGNRLGLEVIPCIQTLGHFEQYLKWQEAAEIKDTDKVLLAGNDQTYCFIEKLIETLSDCFTTKKIHIGLDESFDLGLGKYLTKNGYKPQADIFAEHIQRVKEILNRYGMEPIIWGDMYFSFGKDIFSAYCPDAVIPERARELFPEEFSITYWDYYHTQQEYYESMIDKHRQISKNLVFAGGIWTWNGLVPDYHKTFATMNAAMPACKRKNVQDVFAAVWGDDGCETDYMFSLPGAVLLAEHCYRPYIDDASVDAKCRLLFGVDLRSLRLMGDAVHPKDGETLSVKRILYSDILAGLADCDTADPEIIQHYHRLEHEFQRYAKAEGSFQDYFTYLACICRTAADKVEISIQIHQKDKLEQVRDVLLPALKEDYLALKNIHMLLWYRNYKPFGFEVMDGRYGTKYARIDTAIYRIDAYLKGDISALEEVDEKRLPFEDNHKWCNSYVGISSAYLGKGC